MKYQHYFFDLYGTLADIHTDESKKELWNGLALWYQSHGALYTAWQLKRDYKKLVLNEMRQVLAEHPDYIQADIRAERVFHALYLQKGIDVFPETVTETALFFRTVSRSYIRLYPLVRTMLCDLRNQRKHCYLLTNAQEVFTMPELKLLGIADLFDGIVISSCEECAKPDPHFFEIAHQRYRIDKSSSVMIGNDPRTDIAGANAYGIDSVYIHSSLSPKWTGTPESTYVIANGSTEALRKLLLSDRDIGGI